MIAIDRFYPHSLEFAIETNQTDLFYASDRINRACLQTIDEAIAKHNSNIVQAVADVIPAYGFSRVFGIMGCIAEDAPAGSFGLGITSWADRLIDKAQPEYSFAYRSSPEQLQDFIIQTGLLCSQVLAASLTLQPEHGQEVGGYIISRSVMCSDGSGFVLGESANRIGSNLCTTWYCRYLDGRLDCEYGNFFQVRQRAEFDFATRVAGYLATYHLSILPCCPATARDAQDLAVYKIGVKPPIFEMAAARDAERPAKHERKETKRTLQR